MCPTMQASIKPFRGAEFFQGSVLMKFGVGDDGASGDFIEGDILSGQQAGLIR